MVKIKGWKKTDQLTREIRRPKGYRVATMTIYRNDDRDEVLQLIVMPRRPQFFPYGSVGIEGELVFEGTKKEAEDYAYNYMRENPNV